jgi:hypothetical protein
MEIPLMSQFTNWDGRVFTIINITLSSSQEDIDKIKAKLDGKTFMNFEVHAAPVGGCWNVFVQTTYDAPKNEILGMLISVLATS